MIPDPAFECLLEFIRDEFRGVPEVRVSLRHPSTTLRSPDLVQDYDAERSSVHRLRGVMVRAGGRDYFFPDSWSDPRERTRVEALVREIRLWIGAE